MTNVLYLLAKYPSIQEKLINEVKNLQDEDIENWSVVNNLVFLNAVVNETLRFLPLAARIDRRCVQDVNINGIQITKGTLIIIPVYAMHHDPDHFEDAHLFKPERFLPGYTGKDNSDAFLPFGTGPRNCVGMRFALMGIKFALVRILRELKFEWDPSTKVSFSLLQFHLD